MLFEFRRWTRVWSIMWTCLSIQIVSTLADEPQSVGPSKPRLRIGVDANYSLGMEREGSKWNWEQSEVDLFQLMAERGATEFRVRLWTKDEGVNGKDYATEVVQRALSAGLNPYLVIFLSEDWADLMKQPIPEAWKDLTFEERKVAVEEYSRKIVQHFRSHGLTNHLYEIGNEIDYGICGEYPGKSSKKNPESLARRLWPRSAEIIKSSQAGVLAADPDAKFMLHISHWWDPDFCVAFFRFMKEHGVQLDYAGLSYFPSSNIGGSRDFAELGECVRRLAADVGCKVIIPETAYPSTRDFKGQFSRWKYEVMGYPMTEAGQRRWLADLFTFCNAHPDIDSVYYWSPEWYGEGMWKGFALFDTAGQGKEAWRSLQPETWTQSKLKSPVFLELNNGTLIEVPVEPAKQQYRKSVSDLLKRTNGVNIEHIKLLEEVRPVVNGYALNLKSSLQENLSISLVDPTQSRNLSIDESNSNLSRYLSQLNPEDSRIVILSRSSDEASQRSVIETIQGLGFQADSHPMKIDQPIVFGMSDEKL